MMGGSILQQRVPFQQGLAQLGRGKDQVGAGAELGPDARQSFIDDQGVGIAGHFQAFSAPGGDIVERRQQFFTNLFAALDIGFQEPAKQALVTAGLCPGIAAGITVESVGHGLLLSSGIEWIRGADAAILNVPLDGEPMARWAAEALTAALTSARSGKDGFDHHLAGQAVGIQG